MIDPVLLQQLRRIVGPDHVLAGHVGAEVYSYDASLAQAAPGVVVFPGDTAETAAVVRALSAAGVPCTPRGFGTNLSGGSVALQHGVVICLTRLNRILHMDIPGRILRVQCGVTNLEVQNALAPLGYFFAPDPASQKAATLGGNIGENSGGPHCLKYGVTVNHILGLEVVLPDGEVHSFGGEGFDPPGYDLRGLFVGSEGTLGIATEAVLRIMPRAEAVITMLAVYDDIADAARSVTAIISQGIVPATLEMMDTVIIGAVEDSIHCGYPRDAAAVLIIEVEGLAAGLGAQAARIQALCMAQGCRSIREASDSAERNQLWAGRRGAFGAIARIAPSYLVADCTVPRTRLPEALLEVARLCQHHGFKSGNVFHAGDGNLHPLLLFDARDKAQLARVHEAAMDITAACVRLGGTITGEHGVGMEKIGAMRLVFSEHDLDFQRAVRKTFDPRETFNPGKMFPPPVPSAATPVATPAAPPPAPAGEWLPADAQEACECVRAAARAGLALLPAGSGCLGGFGNHPDRPEIRLRSDQLCGVIDVDPANQVAVFGSGTPWAAAQARLLEHRQWIPIRPPLSGACTLGGMVALGACGPERMYHGAPRDRMLGLKFVSGLGREIVAGGKVVKNVAGYDMTRLLTGSAGTLGFLTELNFRTASVPEVCRALRVRGDLAACARAAAAVLHSTLEPVFVTAVSRGPEPGWELRVGFEGFAETVEVQIKKGQALIRESGLPLPETFDYPLLEGAHAADLAAFCSSAFAICANLPAGAVAGFPGDAPTPPGSSCRIADFACGRVSLGLPALSGPDWQGICARTSQAGGSAVVTQAPEAFKQQFDVFGPPRPEWRLLHDLKDGLDPGHVFAPGRLPGRKG
ncbi:MAG: FAD-linked oxidase C-terminal domain-containing protein [bacterium]